MNRNLYSISLVMLSTLSANSVFAVSEEQAKTRISTTAHQANLDLQLKSSLTSRDNGFKRSEEVDPNRETKFQFELLRFGAKHSGIHTNARIEIDFDRLSEDSFVHTAYLDYQINSTISVRLGKEDVLIGGWEQKEPAAEALLQSTYFARRKSYSGAAFAETAPAATLGLNLGDSGTLKLQVTDDVSKGKDKDVSGFNGNSDQPAFFLQYTPVVGPVLPILQVGTYDINHSKFILGGIKADLGRLHSTFDYLLDFRAINRDLETPIRRITNVAYLLSYEFKNAMRPFAKYDYFDSRLEGETSPANESVSSCLDRNCFTNNGHEVMAGAWLATPVAQVSPYIAYTMRIGRFREPTTLDADAESVKRESIAQFGLSGRL